jgi:hypothetical protein
LIFTTITGLLLNIKSTLSSSTFEGYKPIVALYEHKKRSGEYRILIEVYVRLTIFI